MEFPWLVVFVYICQYLHPYLLKNEYDFRKNEIPHGSMRGFKIVFLIYCQPPADEMMKQGYE